MMDSVKYAQAVKNAKHYLAVGQKEIYLSAGPYPWHIAESCEPSGSHRLDIYTSIWFRGTSAGLSFRWNFDIEDYGANGKGHYEIKTAEICDVMKQLKPKARKAFAMYLKACAEAVEKKGQEWQGYADRQLGDARILRQAAAE